MADELIRLDTTIIGIDSLINKASTAEEAKVLFTVKDVIYNQQRFADVQPVKRGRWIEQKHIPANGYNYNVPYSTYICSSCGLEIHNDEYSKYVRGTYTNCPVCTARMDGDT